MAFSRSSWEEQQQARIKAYIAERRAEIQAKLYDMEDDGTIGTFVDPIAVDYGHVRENVPFWYMYETSFPPFKTIVVSKAHPTKRLPVAMVEDPRYELIQKCHGKQFCLIRQERNFICPLNGQLFRANATAQAEQRFILNPGTFKFRQHREFVLPTTQVFSINIVTGDGLYAPVNKFGAFFVPKLFTTTMKGRYEAVKQLKNKLPLEIVELLCKQLGGPNKLTGSTELSPLSFKYDVTDRTEYTTLEPTEFVPGQFYSYKALLDLTEKGILDIAIEDSINGNLMVLTEGNYEHVFSNGESCRLVQMFKTTDDMLKYRQRIINNLQISLKKLEEL